MHPAAKTLVDIAKSQDAEVGDGTTSVVMLAGMSFKYWKLVVQINSVVFDPLLHPFTYYIFIYFPISGEFLKQCKPFVEEGVHPRVIIKSFRRATQLALEKIKELSVSVGKENKEELRELLVKCAATAMSSKLIHQQKDFFSNMVRAVKLRRGNLL